MVHKTRRHYSHKNKKSSGVYTIPELRRSFEHIEEFVDNKIHSREPKEKIVRDLQKEWSRVFLKDLSKKTAQEFINGRYEHIPPRRHKTLKRKGGAASLTGAPLDYTTRPGIYLAPGQIPDKDGGLPLSTGGGYGSYVQYVDKGFWNPEPGQSYDPVPGQPAWPVPMKDTGSNLVNFSSKGGKRRTQKTRKLRRGGGAGAILSQAFNHPISSSSPPGILQDAQDMWYGKEAGPSPDQVQR